MTFVRQRVARTLAAVFLAFAASGVHAEWQPQWSTAWEYPELLHSTQPQRVGVASDGATFAAVGVTHHSQGHVALMKFDVAGDFLWLRERVGGSATGMVIDNGQVVIAGGGTSVYVTSYDAMTGNLLWDRQVSDGHTPSDTSNLPPQLTIDANGNLMLALSDHGDYVVARFDPAGNALPTWRRMIESDPMNPDSDVLATGIVALPDGGAIVTGQGRGLGGGYVTVRLDAQGNGVFTDVDPGDIGNPLGPAHVSVAADGSVFVAAAPESFGGVPRARVRKLSSSGAPSWSHIVSHPGDSTVGTTIHGLALAASGDPIIEVAGLLDPFRVLRLNAASGEVVWDVDAPIVGSPIALAIAPNHRVMVSSEGAGQQSGGIAELDSNGNWCRVAHHLDMFSTVIAAAGSNGWSVLGATQVIPGTGRDAFVSHFDGGGACTLSDILFVDGFE